MNEDLSNQTSRNVPLTGDVWRGHYTLHLADNSLIMGHRLSEWTGHGPMLEQDIALSNIALDLIGQSRNFYQYAASIANAEVNNNLVSEDSLAYLRDAADFKNLILTELPNGDWGRTILKLFFFSTYQYFLYQKLIYSSDKQLSAIAEKSLKEVTYHVRWSSEWVIRLGDGTPESNNRMYAALNDLWKYTNEIFVPCNYEIECAYNNIGVNVTGLRDDWSKQVTGIFSKATLPVPLDDKSYIHYAGKQGLHTKHLHEILLEMQYLQRKYPGCEW